MSEPGVMTEEELADSIRDSCPYCGYGPVHPCPELPPSQVCFTFCQICASLLIWDRIDKQPVVRYPEPAEVELLRFGPSWLAVQRLHNAISAMTRLRPRPLPLPPLPPGQSVVVAELSKSWPDPESEPDRPRLIAHLFEDMIEANQRRGLRLVTFQLHRIMSGPDRLNETIIAVFERVGPAAKVGP